MKVIGRFELVAVNCASVCIWITAERVEVDEFDAMNWYPLCVKNGSAWNWPIRGVMNCCNELHPNQQ